MPSLLHQLFLVLFFSLFHFLGLMKEMILRTDDPSLIAHPPLGVFNVRYQSFSPIRSLKRWWFCNNFIYILIMPLRVCNDKSSNKMGIFVCFSHAPPWPLEPWVPQTSESQPGNKQRSKQMPVRPVALFSWLRSC